MSQHKESTLRSLIIGSIGIVFGDIGTSPLYALKSCFLMSNLAVVESNIIGLISLIFWILLLVVTLKYVYLVLKFDNNGEGGILALSSLCAKYSNRANRVFIVLAGVFGAALFFSDGVITPAISVLSSIEGLALISPIFSKYIILIAVILLIGLFAIQKKGTGLIGRYFGIIMVLWFFVLGIMGIYNIWLHPVILKALNPIYAIKFFIDNGLVAFSALGAGVLVVTGAETLYADLGHFGRKPISYSWSFFIMPCLVLNYLGQGGLLINSPGSIINPFYSMVPVDFLYPLILLSTIATILASQSVISGVFSVAWQGIMLDYLPRMKVEHTSDYQIGQVYIPAVNYILCFMTISAVLKFGNSENLSIAYGLSVAGTMLITSLMILFVAIVHLKWSTTKVIMIFIPLIMMDIIFVVSNVSKITDGAWYTLLITISLYSIIKIWRRGNLIINSRKLLDHSHLKDFLLDYHPKYHERIPGTAIFMTRHVHKVPNSLLVHLSHNKFFHEKMVFISLVTQTIPRVKCKNRFLINEIIPNIFSITVEYGFKEVPNLKKIINMIKEKNIILNEDFTFYLSKGEAVASPKTILNGISQMIYVFLSRVSLSAYEFYEIPNKNVVVFSVRYLV